MFLNILIFFCGARYERTNTHPDDMEETAEAMAETVDGIRLRRTGATNDCAN